VAGYFSDKYGSYVYPFSGVAVICAATGVLLIFAKPPVKPRIKHAGRDKIAAAAQAM